MSSAHVIIQTLWRSRGTYFWTKLRNDIRNRVYYEPLHEELATKHSDEWQKDFSTGIFRTLRHPTMDRHYACKYSLRKDGVMQNFSVSFADENFFLTAEDEDIDLERYLQWLVDYAGVFGQRACFKFTRGGLRAGFLRRKLGGRHIYINRPPSEIVASFATFGPNNYFIQSLIDILIRNSQNDFCVAVANAVKIPHASLARCPETSQIRAQISGVVFNLSNLEREAIVSAFWLAYLMEGLAACDLLIDTERLGAEEAYRLDLASRTQDLFGAGRFEDFRGSTAPALHDETLCALRDIAKQSERLRTLADAIPARAFDTLGGATQQVLARAVFS